MLLVKIYCLPDGYCHVVVVNFISEVNDCLKNVQYIDDIVVLAEFTGETVVKTFIAFDDEIISIGLCQGSQYIIKVLIHETDQSVLPPVMTVVLDVS